MVSKTKKDRLSHSDFRNEIVLALKTLIGHRKE